jgi:thymidylate synthase (FAD)
MQDELQGQEGKIPRAGNGDVGESVMNKIDVLDHGFVRLVDHMGSDLSIVRAARVSHDAAWRAGENEGSDRRLINYLWKNKHTTPFESVQFTFEVKAPIFVFRQWHRHRTWSYNELSARYRELSEEVYLPNLRAQSSTNKQGSGKEIDPLQAHQLQDNMVRAYETSFNVYKLLLTQGVAREIARSVLPVATYSHMFASVNLLNLLKFLTLRCDSHAQYEIRVYADAMLELITPIVPTAVEAWKGI